MSNPRFWALQEAGHSAVGLLAPLASEHSFAEVFNAYVFDPSTMEKVLPSEVYLNVVEAMQGRAQIRPDYADVIALAMKEWALAHGATHYTHWFQPLTGASAEKHDAFLDPSGSGAALERFSGKQLIQGEPDASSFPSGGLRSTYEARGYTGWDPTSPVFLWKAGDGMTLCIPSIFFSWTGEVLDMKIPLLRSDAKIDEACLRLLRLVGIQAEKVYSTLGLEQEYFVIDRALRNLRPDLLLLGKTVYGALPPKCQELQDHYLGSVKDRILAFMLDFEIEALKLGIPVKTRHNEVAPAQHEVAPLFENASKAVDHNILLMELMRHIAVKHKLSCLLAEKPFKGFNGSGKHSNWSLATDTGINLLDPTDTPGDNLHFLILLTAILDAVHRHAALLRASIGSASNDYRLGGHEAPPAIMSVYLGGELELIFDNIEHTGGHLSKRSKEMFDLGLAAISGLRKDNTDRNRTSPFAFTGNKFEFRAVGSSAHPALPITVLNAAVAESLRSILDDIESAFGKKGAPSREELSQATFVVIRRYLKGSRPIRYSGDNYSEAWKKEAKKRDLPIYERSPEAFEALKLPTTITCFKGILNEQELISRYEIAEETYLNNLHIEINLMLDIFYSQLLPVALEYQKEMATSIERAKNLVGKLGSNHLQLKLFQKLHALIEKALEEANDLKHAQAEPLKGKIGERVRAFVALAMPKMENLRKTVDTLEEIIDDRLWPLPKYRELLFII